MKLKKGDILKFKTGSNWKVVGPYGDGYRFRINNQKGLSWQPTAWLDMMFRDKKVFVKGNYKTSKTIGTMSNDYYDIDKYEAKNHKPSMGRYVSVNEVKKMTKRRTLKNRRKNYSKTSYKKGVTSRGKYAKTYSRKLTKQNLTFKANSCKGGKRAITICKKVKKANNLYSRKALYKALSLTKGKGQLAVHSVCKKMLKKRSIGYKMVSAQMSSRANFLNSYWGKR